MKKNIPAVILFVISGFATLMVLHHTYSWISFYFSIMSDVRNDGIESLGGIVAVPTIMSILHYHKQQTVLNAILCILGFSFGWIITYLNQLVIYEHFAHGLRIKLEKGGSQTSRNYRRAKEAAAKNEGTIRILKENEQILNDRGIPLSAFDND